MGIVRAHCSTKVNTNYLFVNIPFYNGRSPYLCCFNQTDIMLKVGILGGGQLGRMLLQAAANYPVTTYVMENEEDCPAAHLCHHFTKGDIRSFDAVYAFGKELDALTIEIENVNVDALEKLEAEGVKVYPKPAVLRTIKNKILQKEYYASLQIPTAPFRITQNREALHSAVDFLPAVHKLGEGGYDGRGVQIIKQESDLNKGFDAPSVLEKMVDIDKEIAIIVAINEKGQTALYPPVEMVFDPVLNLLDYQICPADIDKPVLWKIEAVALAVVRNFNSPGLFAVEMFLDRKGEVYVNETAPRVHNSGHHSIEAHYSSQFDMLWRVILQYPLGNTAHIMPSLLINLLGAEGFSGTPEYEGLEQVLAMETAFVHIYGKGITKPGRKMGHITLLGRSRQDLLYHYAQVKQGLLVKSN